MIDFSRRNVHIDWSETTVGDRAADSAGKSESGVKVDAGKLFWCSSESLLNDGINLG